MCDETTCVGRIFGYTKTKAKPCLRYLMFVIVQSQKLSLNFNFRGVSIHCQALTINTTEKYS